VQVRCNERVANHIGPEPRPCLREEARARLGRGERGPAFGPRIPPNRMPTPFLRRKAMRTRAPSQVRELMGVVRDPDMFRSSLCGNREISELTWEKSSQVRIGKARSRSR